MSNNQFLSVEKDYENVKWEVWVRDADTGEGHPEKSFDDELEAYKWAAANDDTEYGIQNHTPVELAKPEKDKI